MNHLTFLGVVFQRSGLSFQKHAEKKGACDPAGQHIYTQHRFLFMSVNCMQRVFVSVTQEIYTSSRIFNFLWRGQISDFFIGIYKPFPKIGLRLKKINPCQKL